MGRGFEPFYDFHGQSATRMGVPYNELFSTEEIRRLTFTRILARKNDDLSPLIEEDKASPQPDPVANLLMTANAFTSSWLFLGLELFYYPSLTMTVIMIKYSQLLLRISGFEDIP